MSPSDNDADLLARIANGDRAALPAFYERHQTRVFRYAARLTGNEAVAEELVSEVFIDVWRQAGRFEGRSRVSTWVLSITRNKALGHLRKRREAEIDEEAIAAIPDEADTPELVAQKSDKGALLRACIDRLGPQHREVIDLVYYHECSVADVSRIVGIPANTVKTRMFHARKKLSDLMQAAGIDRGWP